MNVTCPTCQAAQDIADDTADLDIWCPACQRTFRVSGLPDPEWESITASAPVSKKRSLKLDLDEDETLANMISRGTAGNRVDLVNDAMAQTWFASQVMFWAGLITAANLVYNIYQFLTIRVAAAGPLDGPFLIGFLIGIAIFVVMLACIFAASQSLYWLGPRWRIIVAIVVNLVFALLLGAGAAFNVYVFTTVNVAFPMTTVLITIAANATSSALNLMAGVLAIRTMCMTIVNAAYQAERDAAALREERPSNVAR